jgi:hypothetical protein
MSFWLKGSFPPRPQGRTRDHLLADGDDAPQGILRYYVAPLVEVGYCGPPPGVKRAVV